MKDDALYMDLITRKLSESLNDAEEKQFQEWLEESKENELFFEELTLLKKNKKDVLHILNPDAGKAWLNIQKKSVLLRRNARRKKQRDFVFRMAAVFLVCIGAYFFFKPQNRVTDTLDPVHEAVTFQTEYGKTEILNPENNKITNNQGQLIGTNNGNELVFSGDGSTPDTYNTVHVPRGKRFTVVLPDSSKIYLNSESSLKFPADFKDKQNRMVFLKGEGYFEVTKDSSKPFIVSSHGIQTRVLGTKFNITAYSEDHSVRTVLTEGAVALYDETTGYLPETSVKLNPDQCATWNELTDEIEVKDVDVSPYIAWIKGVLMFNKEPFSEIVKRMERYYNVEIQNNNKELNKQVFTAKFVDEHIEDVLASFNKSYNFSYTIESNTIIIN